MSVKRCVAFTAVGVVLSVAVPSPSCPDELVPQQNASPDGVSPHACPSPTATLPNRTPSSFAPETDAAPQQTTPASFVSTPHVALPPALISLNAGAPAFGPAVTVGPATGRAAVAAAFPGSGLVRDVVSAPAPRVCCEPGDCPPADCPPPLGVLVPPASVV